ncbi:hypothetical protein J2787_002684 [Chryseobacterium rhizosphaerae]|uniref:GLPGLI family protein n=1 Tax=Chryseobacterium rhizosphaerae TaxID=395937 RepID=A0AAE3YAX0_9FLAO|nr:MULTISPECIES: hypothetical protein [Chryseobacterium]MBL3550197.1 hypothetical protein [Chryseobacterium sp. KMC2]MDR6527292.1 hypothetical protein [Chryseobacterium rhizosphaerae]
MYRKILISVFAFISFFCFSQIAKGNDNLYVFIGKKIDITEFDPNSNPIKAIQKEVDEETGDTIIVKKQKWFMDRAFHCKYIIINNLKNNLPEKTIEFNTYDHYGRPGFESFENVILYISKNKDGKFFHQKYTYDPVYKINGKWVGILSFIISDNHLDLWRKFVTIDINQDDSIKINIGNCDKKCQEIYYPWPYFKVKKGFVYPKKAFEINDILAYRLITSTRKSID